MHACQYIILSYAHALDYFIYRSSYQTMYYHNHAWHAQFYY